MTTHPTKDIDRMGAGDESAGRYAELDVGDDEFIVYDREKPEAWIQSSVVWSLEDSSDDIKPSSP